MAKNITGVFNLYRRKTDHNMWERAAYWADRKNMGLGEFIALCVRDWMVRKDYEEHLKSQSKS